MAENENLDLGHKSRWRMTRIALDDPNRSLSDVACQAASDFERMSRLLPIALRKAQPLLILLRATQTSARETRIVVESFQEKRLATLVVDAIQLSPSADPTSIAQRAAGRLVESLIDQVVGRAARKHRLKDLPAHAELRARLKEGFEPHRATIAASLESSLRGDRIKSVKRLTAQPAKPSARGLLSMALLNPRAGEQHA